jgi:hypothetical protein
VEVQGVAEETRAAEAHRVVTDERPNRKLRDAMNDINAQKRLRVAAQGTAAEAQKMLIVKVRPPFPLRRPPPHEPPSYSDEKFANREIRVWHFVIENGY